MMLFQAAQKKSLVVLLLLLGPAQALAFFPTTARTHNHIRTALSAEPAPNGSRSSTAPAVSSGSAEDADRRQQKMERILDWDKIENEDDDRTPVEAVRSASLYMNPATERIAPTVKVSWEPEVADLIRRLERVSNPNRPFLVGVVGIPGSGR